jgi:hypothetical protein
MRTFLLFLACLSSMPMYAATDPWPRSFDARGYTFTLYSPETTGTNGLTVVGRSAFSIASAQDNTVFGAYAFEATFVPIGGKDSVALSTFRITGISLPDSLESKRELISSEIHDEVVAWKIHSTKKAISSSSTSGQSNPMAPADLNNTPPVIIVRERLSILIFIDGEPTLERINDVPFQYIKNSMVPIIYDPSTKTYYLPNGKDWYRTRELTGSWSVTTDVPSGIRSLIKLDDTDTRSGLDIVVVTKPSELISFDGPVQWEPLPGSRLLFAKNSDYDVFKDISTQLTFVLISGRWFSASTFNGPWTFVPSDKLPASFNDIPPDGPQSGVRTSIAGTPEANQAVLDAIVPVTAAVDRSKATLTVTYDGEPWFEQIQGTTMQYAVNTTTPVVRVGNMYYACDEAIWFISPSPTGPWAVSDKRPDEIDQIPSSNPISNVKHVYVYNSTPTVVYVGYLPGYHWTFIHGPTIVFGTGFHYNPWFGPHFYPRPVTWGFHFHYSRFRGWGVGVSFFRPPFHPMMRPGFRPPPPMGRMPVRGPRPPNVYNRPGNVNRPNVSPRVPTNAVNRPTTMPNNRPAARPGTGANTRPGTGTGANTRPGTGTGAATRPNTRPATPTYRPSAPTQRPSTMPANRPMNQSAARPSTSRPSGSSARPSGGGGRRR